MSSSLGRIVSREAWIRASDVAHVPHDVVVIQLLKETDFTDCSAWNALVFCLEPYLLKSYDSVVTGIPGLVYNAVGACR